MPTNKPEDKPEIGRSGEIRHSTWVNAEILIAPSRGSDSKPNDFKNPKRNLEEQIFDLLQKGGADPVCQEKVRQIIQEEEKAKIKKCPFCPGNEERTPMPTLLVIDQNDKLIVKPYEESQRRLKDWQCRVVPNAFPAMRIEGISKFLVDQYKAETIDAHGAHEVIIETANHFANCADYSLQQIVNWLLAIIQRTEDLYLDPNIFYVSIFKNYGSEAGASLTHPHTQLIGLPLIPEKIIKRLNRLYKYKSGNGYPAAETTISRSIEGGRVVAQNKNYLALVPYEQRFPFETWIMPRTPQSRFCQSQSNLLPLAEVMKETFLRLKGVFGELPGFNFYLDECPPKLFADNSSDFVSWRWRLTPRINKIGGFELQTDMYICTVNPDDAARLLQSVKI